MPADPETPVPELHGIMNAELRGARHCRNSRNHLACPVRNPNHHSGRRTGVPPRAKTMSRISYDRLRPAAPDASPRARRSRGGDYHFHVSAGSGLQNRIRLPRFAAESELLVAGLRRNDHQQAASDVFLSNRDFLPALAPIGQVRADHLCKIAACPDGVCTGAPHVVI